MPISSTLPASPPPTDVYLVCPDGKRFGPYTSWVAAEIAAWGLGLKDYELEHEPNF
jgi:hypothetical protein